MLSPLIRIHEPHSRSLYCDTVRRAA